MRLEPGDIRDDRDYWRCFDDKLLLEQARYAPTAELAIVLAERLNAMTDKWMSAKLTDEND